MNVKVSNRKNCTTNTTLKINILIVRQEWNDCENTIEFADSIFLIFEKMCFFLGAEDNILKFFSLKFRVKILKW